MLLAIVFLYALFKRKRRNSVTTYIYAITLWTLCCYIITEGLSLGHLLTGRGLLCAWGIVNLCLLILLVIKIRRENLSLILIKNECSQLLHSKIVICFFIYTVVMVACALIIIPYNWDSMTYHCARLFHWAQNKSVAHYATGNSRQVSSPVLAAFVNVNVYILTKNGGSVLNLLQCVSYLSNGMLVYAITKKLQLSSKSCVLAAVLFYSMPIAFAEALTTQVDNFSAFWLLSFVYLLLDFTKKEEKIRFDRETAGKVAVLSLCIAFGYLSKPSVGFGILLFAIWVLIMIFARKDNWKVFLYALGAGILMVIILLPEFGRNIHTFHAIASTETGARQLIGSLHPKHILVNLLKNIAFNLPCVWLYQSSHYIYLFVNKIAAWLRIDINSPVISEDGREFSVHQPQTYDCDMAVNPVIVWAILIGVVIFVISLKNYIKNKENSQKIGYFIVSAGSFFLFCAVLRWEPFVSRYMISYLALLCPAIGIVLDIVQERMPQAAVWGAYVILYFLCMTEMLGLFLNYRDIVKDYRGDKGYFVVRNGIYNDYEEITEYINTLDIKSLGVYIGSDSYEYPLIQMLSGDLRIEHVNVGNETAIYADDSFMPEMVITYEQGEIDSMSVNGQEYVMAKEVENGKVWKLK